MTRLPLLQLHKIVSSYIVITLEDKYRDMASKLALLMMVGLILTSCKEEDQKTKDLVQGYTATNSNSSPGYALKIISWDSTVLEQYLSLIHI